ncbi:hypothetical protein AB0B88_21050 [Micromonospora haikouensis]|uniref:hypothetical protein n=1 Tax=Micromonospora haikouensis TaxID=686309 RepID=UPI0033FC1112
MTAPRDRRRKAGSASATGSGASSWTPRKGRAASGGKKTKRGGSAGGQRSAGGVAARFPGICVTCERGYPAGVRLGQVGDGWAHLACAEAVRERDRILRGETFAGHKPSDWRRGKAPSSTRATR